MGILFVLFSIFFLMTFIFIFNRDKIMSILYLSLFLYSFFPLIARVYYNDKISIYSHVTLNSINTIYLSTFYIILSFLIMFILYIILFLSTNKQHKNLNKISEINQKDLLFGFLMVKKTNNHHNFIYMFTLVSFISYLLVKLLINFNNISYFNQTVIKSDKIWSFMLEFSIILIVIGCFAYKLRKNKIIKFTLIFLNFFLTAILLITFFKIGNRGILIPYILGGICIYMEIKNFKINLGLRNFTKFFRVIFLLIIVIAFSQFIRGNRGGNVETINFSFYSVLSFFKLDQLIFQDYTIPGNSLFFIIDNNIIDPIYVVKSNFGNGIFFLNYNTVAEYISHLVAPNEWFGIGGYIFTEGFLLFGYLGVFFMPLLILISYRFYYKKFLDVNDKNLKLFLSFLFTSLLTLSLVRGQSYLLFKSIYMYFVPALLFFSWVCGYKITIKKLKR